MRLLGRKFQKRKEDFTCDHCGLAVSGTGYTNHCPRCLWGKHVDVHPGDRAATCGGLMEPIGVSLEHGSYRILHRCVACGREFVRMHPVLHFAIRGIELGLIERKTPRQAEELKMIAFRLHDRFRNEKGGSAAR